MINFASLIEFYTVQLDKVIFWMAVDAGHPVIGNGVRASVKGRVLVTRTSGDTVTYVCNGLKLIEKFDKRFDNVDFHSSYELPLGDLSDIKESLSRSLDNIRFLKNVSMGQDVSTTHGRVTKVIYTVGRAMISLVDVVPNQAFSLICGDGYKRNCFFYSNVGHVTCRI